jgi:GT2 family glycosyltransferase
MIAIVVVTLNRAELLRKCVMNVLDRTESTTEIVIWNNASTDGTADYLASLRDERLRVVHSPTNVGLNAYARAFRLTTAPYMVELDDDIVDAPSAWDSTLLNAYVRLRNVGYLAADLVDDPDDQVSRFRHYVRPHEYRAYSANGVRLLEGPTGGGCAMTARELADRVGGFPEHPEIYFNEDGEYIAKIAELGYRAAILADLKVHHTGGPGFTYQSPEKIEFWTKWYRKTVRKQRLKRALLRLPLARRVNARYALFQLPDRERRLERTMRPPKSSTRRMRGMNGH